MIYNKKVLIGLTQQNDKLEFARRAGGQVVRNICVVVFALRRSVSFCCAVNWHLVREAQGLNNTVIPNQSS